MLQMRAVKRAVGSAGGEYLQSPKSTVTDATDGTDATPIIDAAPESYLFPSGEAPVRTTACMAGPCASCSSNGVWAVGCGGTRQRNPHYFALRASCIHTTPYQPPPPLPIPGVL
jgi:hypothetical protein